MPGLNVGAGLAGSGGAGGGGVGSEAGFSSSPMADLLLLPSITMHLCTPPPADVHEVFVGQVLRSLMWSNVEYNHPNWFEHCEHAKQKVEGSQRQTNSSSQAVDGESENLPVF